MPPLDAGTLLSQARDAMTVKRVFGDPHESGDGTVVLPVAHVCGGAGGGEGTQEGGDGSGIGFGFSARPAGVYVIRGGEARWRPALDVNRALLVASGVVVVLSYLGWRMVKTVARRR